MRKQLLNENDISDQRRLNDLIEYGIECMVKHCVNICSFGVNVDFGNKIKAIRISECLSQEAFSRLIDVSISTIRHYEQGARNPNGEILSKITNHQQLKKYTFWLMTSEVLPDSGQICPAFSILELCELTEKEIQHKRA